MTSRMLIDSPWYLGLLEGLVTLLDPSFFILITLHKTKVVIVAIIAHSYNGAFTVKGTQTLQSSSIDRHVNELWLFQIFLDCVGYQQ